MCYFYLTCTQLQIHELYLSKVRCHLEARLASILSFTIEIIEILLASIHVFLSVKVVVEIVGFRVYTGGVPTLYGQDCRLNW